MTVVLDCGCVWDGETAITTLCAMHKRARAKRDQARDMTEAHLDGMHDEIPREFCPLCERAGISTR